jgi:glycosyltransferase involved in cell wall biosynthesis
MEFACQIEIADRMGPDGSLLLVKGWAFAKSGETLDSIRLAGNAGVELGYYGIPRPDVGDAFGGNPQARFSGFSFLTPRGDSFVPCSIEVAGTNGTWHKIADLTTARRQPARPVAAAHIELGAGPRADSTVSAVKTRSAKMPDAGPVLFISHDHASAGSQLLLLRLLRWLRDKRDLSFDILIAVPRAGAVHASEAEKHILSGFESCARVYFLSDLTQAPENLALIRAGYYRLIYANTSTLGWLLPSLRPFSCPVISHVHELGFWIERRTGLPVFQRQMAGSNRVIACSTPVRDYLVREGGVPPEKLVVIHACGSMERARTVSQDNDRATVRHDLGIPAGAFVVAACGTFDWRKGAELFVPICVALRRKLGGKDFRAVWIGDYGTTIVRDQFAHEVKTVGLAGKVELLGPQRDPLRLMLAADCFALPSREDPFPLVMLEAGTLGLPIVGFQDSGGVTEFVGSDAGIIVPYLDLESFAEALSLLARDPVLARRLGDAARQRATQLFDEEVSFRRIAELIVTVQAGAPATTGRLPRS